jgi:small-conductance mechanosensitive channel
MMPFDPQFWTNLWQETLGEIIRWLPNLLGALALLLVGWLVAKVVQFIIVNILRRLRLDSLADHVGISRMLSNAGMDSSVSRLLAKLAYWLLLFVFVLAAAESLGLIGVTETLNSLVGYLPNVLAAALILLLGSLIAQVVGEALGSMAKQAGVTSGSALGQVVRYAVLVFTIILALGQLGIQTDLLTIAASALVIAVMLALAFAFGFGSRDLARNIMAGYHAREFLDEGQRISVRGHSGELIRIGTVKTEVKTGSGLVSLPNSVLTDEEVIVLKSGEAAE